MPPPAHPAVAGPGEPPLTEPRAVVATDREKGRGKKDGATPPPVSDHPSGPVNPPVATVPEPGRPTDPRTAAKPKRDDERPKQEPPQNPVAVVPPVVPVLGGGAAEPGQKPKTDAPAGGFHPPGETRRPIAGEGKPAAPVAPPPGVDPAGAQAQAGAEAARVAREQAGQTLLIIQ